MATLRNATTGETQLVEPEHIFGRAPTASTQIAASYVSAQHAQLRWTGARWVLRDLGSRNGTFLNGDRLTVGEERPARSGMTFSFGKANADPWEFLDDSPPTVMAAPLDGRRRSPTPRPSTPAAAPGAFAVRKRSAIRLWQPLNTISRCATCS